MSITSALKQMGQWKGQDVDVDLDWCKEELAKSIKSIDWKVDNQEFELIRTMCNFQDS